jgi:hypothetical protein
MLNGCSGTFIDGYNGCAVKTEIVLQSQPRLSSQAKGRVERAK